jgi:hypothetical protein
MQGIIRRSFMKSILAIAAVFAASVCHAGDSPENMWADGQGRHTPFEKLEHVFHHSDVAQLKDFQYFDGNGPLANSRGMKCTGEVKKDTTRPSMTIKDQILMLVSGKIVAGQATPDEGPLFPGHPEHDEFRKGIMWGTVGGVNTPEELGAILSQGGYVLNEGEDELSQTTGNVRKSWRTHDGLLLEQDAVINDKGEITDVTSYEYCWFAVRN